MTFIQQVAKNLKSICKIFIPLRIITLTNSITLYVACETTQALTMKLSTILATAATLALGPSFVFATCKEAGSAQTCGTKATTKGGIDLTGSFELCGGMGTEHLICCDNVCCYKDADGPNECNKGTGGQ